MDNKSTPSPINMPVAEVREINGSSTPASRLEAEFKDSYVFRTHLKDDAVKFASAGGIVTLTGTVADESRICWAENTAWGLPGVTSVVNKLETPSEAEAEKSDKWIYRKVVLALLIRRNVSAATTRVEVADGVVTLSGEASSPGQRTLTAEYAGDIDGVTEVRNKIVVVAPKESAGAECTENMDDASVTAHVRAALLTHKSTAGIEVHVFTNCSVTTLTGNTGTSADKAAVSRLVNDIFGVSRVVNDMTVGSPKTT